MHMKIVHGDEDTKESSCQTPRRLKGDDSDKKADEKNYSRSWMPVARHVCSFNMCN